MYTNNARKHQDVIINEFKVDLGYMRSFQMIVEESPNMFCIMSPDLDATILYANDAFEREIATASEALLGRYRKRASACLSVPSWRCERNMVCTNGNHNIFL
jgi:hypothetical protein